MLTQYYGWDVGGAHLKFAALAADGTVNDVRQIACPLWQGPEMLQNALSSLVAEFGLQSGVHAISNEADAVAVCVVVLLVGWGERSEPQQPRWHCDRAALSN